MNADPKALEFDPRSSAFTGGHHSFFHALGGDVIWRPRGGGTKHAPLAEAGDL